MYSASRTEGLPEGWEYAYDSSSGAWYYFNSVKGITQWTPPEGAGPDVTATQAADGSHPSKAANGGVGDDQQPTAAPGHQRSSSPSAAAAATERPCGISSPSSAHGLDGYYYRDPFSVLQGPFTAQQLYMWRSSLPMDLPVWYVDEGGIKMLQGGGGRHGTFPPVIEGMAATGGEEQEGEGMQDSRGGGAGTAVMKSNNADAAETCEEGPSSHMQQEGSGGHDTHPTGIEGMTAIGEVDEEAEGAFVSTLGDAGAATTIPMEADSAAIGGESAGMQGDASKVEDEEDNATAKIGAGAAAIGGESAGSQGDASKVEDEEDNATAKMGAGAAAIGGESAGSQGDASKVEDEEDNATAKIDAGAGTGPDPRNYNTSTTPAVVADAGADAGAGPAPRSSNASTTPDAGAGPGSAPRNSNASTTADADANADADTRFNQAPAGTAEAHASLGNQLVAPHVPASISDVPAAISDAPASISDAPASISDALAAISDVPAAEIAALDGPSAIASTKEAQLVSVPAPVIAPPLAAATPTLAADSAAAADADAIADPGASVVAPALAAATPAIAADPAAAAAANTDAIADLGAPVVAPALAAGTPTLAADPAADADAVAFADPGAGALAVAAAPSSAGATQDGGPSWTQRIDSLPAVLLAGILGDQALLTDWRAQRDAGLCPPAPHAPTAPIWEHWLLYGPRRTPVDPIVPSTSQQPQSAAEPGSYAEAVLAGLPPTDEAVIMAQLAHAQGKTLEELVSFSYEHGGRNSRRQHDAPPATSTLVRNPYSGRLSMQVDEGLSQSATLYKDFGNWVDPDTLEDSLREAAKRKGQQLPASTWKKLKERRLEVKKKMRTM